MDIPKEVRTAIGGVRRCKNSLLKNRLHTLIISKGLSEADFYNKLEISRQVWYSLSWGLWDATPELKIKIALELGVDSAVIWQEEKHGNT